MGDETRALEAEQVPRRGFLAGIGKLPAGAAIGAAALSAVAVQSSRAEDAPEWTYRPVDPEQVYANGVAGFAKSACCQGAWDAIMAELGEPFTTIPGHMMRWGEGGGVGMGSHCGALMGSSTAISLAFGGEPAVSTRLIKELTAWYMQEIGSGSQLCHVSVTEWAKANGVAVESQERKDRCAQVCGSTARQAVLLMNAQAADEPVAVTAGPNPDSTGCITCHGNDGQKNVRNGVALQNCTSCHDPAHQQ